MLTYRDCQEKDKDFVYILTKTNMFDYFEKFLPEGWNDEKFWRGFDQERILILEQGNKRIGFLDSEKKEEGFIYS